MRLIDADALIKYIPAEEVVSKMAIANAPTIDPAKWIPCKDRLPRYQEEVLISIRANGVGIGYLEFDDYYSDISWVAGDDDFYDGGEFELVEAWMPLPDPWRGEEVDMGLCHDCPLREVEG